MIGLEGNSLFCFPRIPMFSIFPEEDWDSREPKLTVSQGTSLKVIRYIQVAGSFEAGNSFKPHCNSDRQWTIAGRPGNSALLPPDIINFAMFPSQRFWWETVSFLDVMWPWNNQWEHALLGKNF